VLLRGADDHATMLRTYGEIDVALDPMPFTGALTTCEALWMGVPVVTLPGQRVVSRQSHAILARIGRGAWSAASADEYIRIARGLAEDETGRADWRRSLRQAMQGSALCDPAAFARGLEGAYRRLWRAFCARQATP
jgi:predicted O-linked N-acetylglucosamine transferase (SPINDLY family)